MTLRLRYHLLFVSLYAALALGNAVLYRSIERAETTWGLAEESKGYAICLAVFLGRERTLSPETLARLQPAFQRLARAGNLGLRYFEITDSGCSGRSLLDQTEVPEPPPPPAELIAELRHSPAAARHVATPAADHDLALGYAAIRSPAGELRAIIGVAARDSVLRTRLQEVGRMSALFCALAVLCGLASAEILTRFTRRGIARLEADAAALVGGEYAGAWEQVRVAELNDLGNTLRSIGEILQDGIRQTRRRFVQAELLPRQEDTAADCQELCDAAPPPAGIAPHVVVRRINRGFPEDFWGLRATDSCWCLAAGRIAPPATPSDLLERIVRANSARDLLLGECLAAPPPVDPWSRLSAVFPCEKGAVVSGGVAGPQRHHTFPTPAQPTAPATRDALGTLAPESLQLARDYLRQFPDQPLGAAAEKLATILSIRDRGLLVIYETSSSPR